MELLIRRLIIAGVSYPVIVEHVIKQHSDVSQMEIAVLYQRLYEEITNE